MEERKIRKDGWNDTWENAANKWEKGQRKEEKRARIECRKRLRKRNEKMDWSVTERKIKRKRRSEGNIRVWEKTEEKKWKDGLMGNWKEDKKKERVMSECEKMRSEID